MSCSRRLAESECLTESRGGQQMAWVYLVIAGLLEIGWPVGLKIAQSSQTRVRGVIMAVLLMGASGAFLWLAQRSIPMGTAYAVWTGIGAVGTLILGMLVYGEPSNAIRLGSASLIVIGIIGLKLAHG
jgi:quaternary ammonium compound-resistance protein SugE